MYTCLTTASLLSVLILIFILLKKWIQNTYSYWSRKGVTQLPPKFPFGNVTTKVPIGEQFAKIYYQLKAKGVKDGGVYLLLRPSYVPIDLDIIKNILIKDFDHFRNHGNVVVNEEIDPLAASLFHMEDEKWSKLRAKVSPTFTSGKIKTMFPTILKCAEGLKVCLNKASASSKPIEIKELLSKFTTDIIGTCAFGIECNTLGNPDSEFLRYGAKVFKPQGLQRIKFLAVRTLSPWLVRLLKIKSTDTDVENFFMGIVKETVNYRETNKVKRKDFMDLLLDLKNNTNNETKISMNEVVAQCFSFFTAGFETSASVMTFALYELANNVNIQNLVRDEIGTVLEKHGGVYSYEAITEMTYLEQTIKETLRKYSPVSILSRKCTKTYRVPKTDVVIEKGTRVNIPIWGIHMDPEYYPDPENFDPDRFSKENELNRPAFAWLPFGTGPRICLGMRFALLESKIGIAKIIQDFEISVNEQTPKKFEYSRQSIVTNVEGGIWLNVSRINN